MVAVKRRADRTVAVDQPTRVFHLKRVAAFNSQRVALRAQILRNSVIRCGRMREVLGNGHLHDTRMNTELERRITKCQSQ